MSMTNYLPLPTVFFFPRQGQIIVYIGGNRYALIGSLYRFFQLLKGRIADRVFHPASLFFRRFLIDASSYKLFRKELVSLILKPRKRPLIDRQQPVIGQVAPSVSPPLPAPVYAPFTIHSLAFCCSCTIS